MKHWYRQLDTFGVDEDIIKYLAELDVADLAIGSTFGQWHYLLTMLRKRRWWQSRHDYGWLCQHTNEMRSLKIDDEVTQRIRDSVTALVGPELAAAAVIRLQLIYGGGVIPHHIDMTRQVSLVIPVVHDHPSQTEFYHSQYNNGDERGFVGVEVPNHPAASITIETVPVVLNTNIVHAVRFAKNLYTQWHPRRSITVKWQHHDFATVSAAIDKYHQKESA